MPLEIPQNEVGLPLPETPRHCRHVRRDRNIRETPKRTFRRKRLLGEHVQPCPPEPAVTQRLDHGVFVDKTPSGNIHQNHSRLHPVECVRVDHPPRLRRVGRRDDDRVTLPIDLIETGLTPYHLDP